MLRNLRSVSLSNSFSTVACLIYREREKPHSQYKATDDARLSGYSKFSMQVPLYPFSLMGELAQCRNRELQPYRNVL